MFEKFLRKLVDVKYDKYLCGTYFKFIAKKIGSDLIV